MMMFQKYRMEFLFTTFSHGFCGRGEDFTKVNSVVFHEFAGKGRFLRAFHVF